MVARTITKHLQIKFLVISFFLILRHVCSFIEHIDKEVPDSYMKRHTASFAHAHVA